MTTPPNDQPTAGPKKRGPKKGRGRGRGGRHALINARKIRIAIIIEFIEGTGSLRARLHDLDSARTFECEEFFADDAGCMMAGERLIIAATQKARELLRLDGNPWDLQRDPPDKGAA